MHDQDDAVDDASRNPFMTAEARLPYSSLLRPRSSSGVLERIIDEDFQRSVQANDVNNTTIDKKFEELSKYLKRGSDAFANNPTSTLKSSHFKRTQSTLKNLIPRYNKGYDKLIRLMSDWKPQREALILNLSQCTTKLDGYCRWSTIVRFLSSSVDVTGTVGGILFRSESGEGWASQALKAASFFGLCGLVSTVAEVDHSKRKLEEMSNLIERDQELLQAILELFEKTEELDSVVQELFPHGIDKEIVKQIQEASAEQNDYLKVFKAAMVSNVGKNTKLFDDKDFLHSLQLFASSEVASGWWNTIIYRKHPIDLDVGRMTLQLEFGQMQSIIFQCIPALPLEQQRLTSLPVAGRILLNLLTMCDSFADLRKGAKSKHSDKLRKYLVKLKRELETVDTTFNMMKPHLS